MLYLVYCFFLLCFVYLLPALAFFPKLILRPNFVFAIPILSSGIVYCIVTTLQTIDLYQSWISLSLAISLGCFASFRLRNLYLAKPSWGWKKSDFFLLLFNFCVILPYLVKLGTHAFEYDDEIYSWNFWAIQHVFSEPIDFSHTGATYPQFFPKLLSFCYQLLGDIQLQCPIRALLGIFPFCMIHAWANMLQPLTHKRYIIYLFFLLYAIAGLKLEQFFNDAYADPVMTACLISSIALYFQATILWKSSFPFSKIVLAFLSVVTGLCACFSKQPALFWSGVCLPALLIYQYFTLKQKHIYWIVLALLSIGISLFWLQTEGHQFYHNDGVLYHSFKGRSWLEQIQYVVSRYLIGKPLLLTLMVVSAFWIRKDTNLKILYYGFIIPELVFWLLFGAYQYRLGQHVVAALILITLIHLRNPLYIKKIKTKKIAQIFYRNQNRLMGGVLVLSCFSASILFFLSMAEKPNVNLLTGGRVALQQYFEKDAQKVYETIYENPQGLIWVPTRYLYGIFYKHTSLTTPDYKNNSPYTKKGLIDELRKKNPDFVFTVSPFVIDGPASAVLAEVIVACPHAFETFATPPNKYSYTTYRINKERLHKDDCLNNLIG